MSYEAPLHHLDDAGLVHILKVCVHILLANNERLRSICVSK